MGNGVEMSLLISATPDAPHRSAERLDPYWDGLWQFGANAQWISRELADRMRAAGLQRTLPPRLSSKRDVAARRLLSHDWQDKLDLLGALASWRTLSAEQAAAFTGATTLASGASVAARDLFAVDMVDVGRVVSAELAGPAAARGTLYRPTRSTAFERHLRPELTYAEWVSVTGGQKYLTGGQYDRHNILAAELALRAAEFTPIVSALGERQAEVPLLAYTSLGLPIPAGGSQQAADGVLVRDDGLRIAVELTASTGHGFARKLERWTQVLASNPVRRQGLAVVFVVADRPNAGHGSAESILATVRKQIARAVRSRPGQLSNRTADRIFAVDWRDWFPASGRVDPSFLDLVASRPSGAGGEWHATSMLDSIEVPGPTEMAAPLSVVSSASGLRCVPHWLRVPQRPELWKVPAKRVDFTDVPYIAVDPRTGVVREHVEVPRGGAPAAVTPKRMRY